jgi:hypothetical protein
VTHHPVHTSTATTESFICDAIRNTLLPVLYFSCWPADPFEAELYTLYSDAETITEESTAKFLQQLEQQLSANAAAYNLQRPGQNMTQTLKEFSAVAADILNYFRERSSQALLSMLRQFSRQGTFTLGDVDPDVLQQEVQQILDVDQLGKYYARMSQRGGEGITTRPATGAQVRFRSCGPLVTARAVAYHRPEHPVKQACRCNRVLVS